MVRAAGPEYRGNELPELEAAAAVFPLAGIIREAPAYYVSLRRNRIEPMLAAREIAAALAYDPYSPRLLNFYGLTQIRAHDLDGARQTLARLARLAPQAMDTRILEFEIKQAASPPAQ